MSSSPRKRPITGSTEAQLPARPAYLQPHVLLTWFGAVGWACLIFFLSTGAYAAPVTGWLLAQLFAAIHLHVPRVVFDIIHFLIRKLAHCTEYGIFSLLLYHSFNFRRMETWNTRNSLSAVVVAGLYSLTDEYHQSFVPGRTASIKDCGIDTLGATLAMVLLYLGRRIQSLRANSVSS